MHLKHLSLLCCFISINTFGQTLTITNGSKEKTFKSGSVYEINLGEGPIAGEGYCCDWSELVGTLYSVTEDSLFMEMNSYTRKMVIDGIKLKHDLYAKDATNFGRFTREDVFALKNFKSLKSKKRKTAFIIVGGLLLFTGIATAGNYIILSDDDSKKTILQSGAIQVGTGIGFLIMSSSKKYRFKGHTSTWRIK